MMSRLSLLLGTLAGLALLAVLAWMPAAAAERSQAATRTPRVVTPTATATRTAIPAATGTVTGTPTPIITGTPAPPVSEVLYEVSLVQHHYDPYDNRTWFTCASPGQGLLGVEVDPLGPRYVGPNAGDFDLWGIVGLFRVGPDSSLSFVPQRPAPYFIDPNGTTFERLPLQEILDLFEVGEAVWIGQHGQAGRLADCDPQFATPTPTEESGDDQDEEETSRGS